MRDRLIHSSSRLIFYGLVFVTLLFIALPLLMLMQKGLLELPEALKSREVQFALSLSLQTSIFSTFVCLLLALPCAFYLHYSRFKNWVMPLLYLPLALPHIVSGVALLLFFGHMGMGGWLEKYFNLSFVFTKQGIIIAQVFVNLPFAIKLLTDGLGQISDKQLFVASTLGANRYQRFRYVIFPTLQMTLITTMVLTWSRALGEFGSVIMIAGATRMKTEILPTSIMLNLSTGDLDIAMSIALILMLISLSCSALFELLLRRRYA